MKVYKVYFNNDPNTWIPLSFGYIRFPNYKREQYNCHNEFNNKFFLNTMGLQKPYSNTFSEDETEKALFFFLDLFDAVKYTSYYDNKYGNFNGTSSEYKILELELPDEFVLKYLGIGSYEFEKECTYNLALEAAIDFDELRKFQKSTLSNKEFIALDNAKIYDNNNNLVLKILEFLSINSNHKSQNYMQCIEQILHILGFKVVLGNIYKSPATGKLKFMLDIPQYKLLLLNKILKEIINEIDENISKYKTNKIC